MKQVFLGWLLLVAVSFGAVEAKAGRQLGDEDPYPLACFDFSGLWKDDSGEMVAIEQEKCKWLKVKTTFDSQEGVTTIVPDDKFRNISGNRWKGVVRHRWNNKQYATIIETHRKLYFEDRHVAELILLEKVNENLLLETNYRNTKMVHDGKEGPEEQEATQKVFRRQSGAMQR